MVDESIPPQLDWFFEFGPHNATPQLRQGRALALVLVLSSLSRSDHRLLGPVGKQNQTFASDQRMRELHKYVITPLLADLECGRAYAGGWDGHQPASDKWIPVQTCDRHLLSMLANQLTSTKRSRTGRRQAGPAAEDQNQPSTLHVRRHLRKAFAEGILHHVKAMLEPLDKKENARLLAQLVAALFSKPLLRFVLVEEPDEAALQTVLDHLYCLLLSLDMGLPQRRTRNQVCKGPCPAMAGDEGLRAGFASWGLALKVTKTSAGFQTMYKPVHRPDAGAIPNEKPSVFQDDHFELLEDPEGFASPEKVGAVLDALSLNISDITSSSPFSNSVFSNSAVPQDHVDALTMKELTPWLLIGADKPEQFSNPENPEPLAQLSDQDFVTISEALRAFV